MDAARMRGQNRPRCTTGQHRPTLRTLDRSGLLTHAPRRRATRRTCREPRRCRLASSPALLGNDYRRTWHGAPIPSDPGDGTATASGLLETRRPEGGIKSGRAHPHVLQRLRRFT
jgi:hypothetical protein